MIRWLGSRFAAFFRATTPDPFVLAIGLTILVFGLAAAVEGVGPLPILRSWEGDTGLFSLLAFTMQMVLILVTGHALASSPAISGTLRRIARVPKTPRSAVALVSAVAIVASLLNWGLGLIVGALLAREVGRSCADRGVRVHYPLVAAAGYTGLMCWHGGFSGTAPLMMTTNANVEKFLGEELAAQVGVIPFTQTVLSIENLIITGGLVILVPLMCAAMTPRPGDKYESYFMHAKRERAQHDGTTDRPPPLAAAPTLPEKLEKSPWLMVVIALPLVATCTLWFLEHGIAQLDPNALNLVFLTAGLILHGNVKAYARAVTEAVKGASGIILQFPFYAGIMGVMRGTGLATTFAQSITAIASPRLFATLTLVSAGLINLFVPSGGGQWAVQGPIAMQASSELGVPAELAIMAVAYGDQLTNMLQPFWALPLLAITGVKARDIIGYTTVVMIAGGIWIATCLVVFSP